MFSIVAVFCMLAGFSAAVAEVMGRKPEHAVLKMLAASAYVVFAVHAGATDSAYGRLVLVALSLSWVGDLLLVGGGGRVFLAGLVSFLLVHATYAAAFLVRGVALVPALFGAAGMLAVGWSVLSWLHREDLPREYQAPVAVYVVGIGVMVALAMGTAWPDLAMGGEWALTGRALVLGAGLFAVSDILVARQRFVQEQGWNRLVGLPLYFAAQLLLASTV